MQYRQSTMTNILPEYDYTLPPELIASAPASPRDAARLMVYDRSTKKVTLDTFRNIATYLPKNSLIVVNETKVLPARIPATKETGGKVDLLYLSHTNDSFTALASKSLRIGSKVILPNNARYTVLEKHDGEYSLSGIGGDALVKTLQTFGKTPIPPYIKNSPLAETELRQEYQAIFAKHVGSSAAPTASLHFTEHVMRDIKNQGHDIIPITLHVGLGTFAPITAENLVSKTLHEEYFEISEEAATAINEAKKNGRPIIAIGTTVVRALESANKSGRLRASRGTTTLFIQPGYTFNIVDSIVTNFHVPRSSLLMLVSAFTGKEKLLELYEQAIKNEFRFFSFGDGMLIV